ncbi:MAG: hypothetical protein K6C99_09615 [Lachnospiraceae bacterium]|nr:hypothetical protein [Lachnospiraceae bacterium]
MTDQQEFIEKISELKDTAILQGGQISEAQIEETFPDLTQDQKNLLLDYFKQNNIGIGEPLKDEEYLDADEGKIIKMYLDELEELEEVDDSLKRVLVIGALNGDNEAKERLTNSYLKAVVDVAKLYTGQGVEVGDLIGEGNVALANAMSLLQSIEKPEDCDEMVMRTVMNAMEEMINAENAEVDVNRKVLKLVMEIIGKAKELSEELRRKCTVEELAEEGGFSPEDIMEAVRVSANCGDYIEI